MQYSEMTAFQATLYELERAHVAAKKSYEEDLGKLRKELKDRGIPIPQGLDKNSNFSDAQPPKLPTVNPNGSLFGSIMNTSGGGSLPKDPSVGFSGFDPSKRPLGNPVFPAKKTLKIDEGHYQPMSPQARNKPQGLPGPMQGMQQQYQQQYSHAAQGHHQAPHQSPHQPQHQGSGAAQAVGPPTPKQVGKSPSLPETIRKGGDDWSVFINPNSTSINKNSLNLELVYSLDHDSVVCCIKFSLDGAFLATGCNHVAQIYEMATGQRLCALMDDTILRSSGDLYIRTVCFSPDSHLLATGAEDRIIRIWDISKRSIRATLKGHEQDIYSLDWSIDGRIIVSGSGDKTVKIWDASTGQCLRTVSNDSDTSLPVQTNRDSGVTSVAINPVDGYTIVAGSLDEMVRIWDSRTGQLLERFVGHTNSVYSVAFSPDGKSVVSGSLDKSLKVWDISPATLERIKNPPSSEKGETLVSASWRQSFSGHGDFVLSVAFPGKNYYHPVPGEDIEWVVSGSKDRTVAFWNASSKDKSGKDQFAQFTLQGHKNSGNL
jgi:WD40 repeat protein